MRSYGARRIDQLRANLAALELKLTEAQIAALDNVSADEKLVVLEEFWAVAQAQDFITQGGIAYAKDVLERALGGEKALEIMGRLSSYIRLSPFEFLRRVEPQQIYNFLQNEHPQTVAIVLSQLDPSVRQRRTGRSVAGSISCWPSSGTSTRRGSGSCRSAGMTFGCTRCLASCWCTLVLWPRVG